MCCSMQTEKYFLNLHNIRKNHVYLIWIFWLGRKIIRHLDQNENMRIQKTVPFSYTERNLTMGSINKFQKNCNAKQCSEIGNPPFKKRSFSPLAGKYGEGKWSGLGECKMTILIRINHSGIKIRNIKGYFGRWPLKKNWIFFKIKLKKLNERSKANMKTWKYYVE